MNLAPVFGPSIHNINCGVILKSFRKLTCTCEESINNRMQKHIGYRLAWREKEALGKAITVGQSMKASPLYLSTITKKKHQQRSKRKLICQGGCISTSCHFLQAEPKSRLSHKGKSWKEVSLQFLFFMDYNGKWQSWRGGGSEWPTRSCECECVLYLDLTVFQILKLIEQRLINRKLSSDSFYYATWDWAEGTKSFYRESRLKDVA